MSKPIYPCFWFDNQAKVAADFYCSVFKNSRITSDTMQVVSFELNGFKLMGLNGGPMFTINPSISLFVLCETLEDTNQLWEQLLEGGEALMPIDKYDWSERYGWLRDKFGLTWQISVVYSKGDPFKITPSMLFTGNRFGKTEEAINFYNSIFENSSVETLVPYPDKDPNAGKVMYSEFNLANYKLIAMDGPGDFSFNEAVSFVVECENQGEIDFFWAKLTEGGEESMCGWLKDRFGVSWQIVPAALGKLMADPVKGPRVVQAFLKMKKFNIDKLLNA